MSHITHAIYPRLVEFLHFDIQHSDSPFTVSVLSWLVFYCRTALASIAETIHEQWFLPSPTNTPRARASRGWIHSLHVSSRQTQSLEPIFCPKLQIYFADFPYAYDVLSDSSCSPRRHAAIINTKERQNQSFLDFLWVFKHRIIARCVVLYRPLNQLLAIKFRGGRSFRVSSKLIGIFLPNCLCKHSWDYPRTIVPLKSNRHAKSESQSRLDPLASSLIPTDPILRANLFPKLRTYFVDFNYAYIVLSHSSCSPKRPAAIINTKGRSKSIFSSPFYESSRTPDHCKMLWCQ